MQRAVIACLSVCILFLGLGLVSGCGNTPQAEKDEQPQLQQQHVAPVPEEPVEKVFVGSVKSDKFHRPNCKWADRIKPANEIWFSSAKHARSKGYEPCKTCKPESRS